VKLPLLIALTLSCNGLLNGLLGLLLGTDPEYWPNLQQMHDVAAAREEQAAALECIVPITALFSKPPSPWKTKRRVSPTSSRKSPPPPAPVSTFRPGS